MERDHQASNIVLIGCKRTSGQVDVRFRCCLFFLLLRTFTFVPLPQVLAGLLTWWLGGVGGEGESQENNIFLNSNKKGSKRLTITGGCFCVSGLGLLLLPELKLVDGGEMILAAVPALLGVGDGLVNLQVFCFQESTYKRYVCS